MSCPTEKARDVTLTNRLALEGGPKVITNPMPKRAAFGPDEVASLTEAIDYYQTIGADPSYYGPFEQRYCDAFSDYMGGGHTVAVATGTGALYVAVAALELPKGSHVVVSPITDPGTLNAIVLNDLSASIADAKPGSLNTCWSEIERVLTPKTSAILLVHCAGIAADIETIHYEAKQRGIKLIEDCSQSPGASVGQRKLGAFGDIAALSTMYRKTLSSGGSGGLIYCKTTALHQKVLSYADRGKDFSSADYEERNAETYLFPALNWNTTELSCAIGIASLRRLDQTIQKRSAFCRYMIDRLTASQFCSADPFTEGTSPFFLTLHFHDPKQRIAKHAFCDALMAEGVSLNPHYRFVVSQWQWAKPYLTQHQTSPNALAARDHSFNLYLNEHYCEATADQIMQAILKVEFHYRSKTIEHPMEA